MEKIWFIINDSKHEGPYSLEQLEGFYEKDKISDETQIWKEGMDQSKEFREILLDEVGVPDLPPPIPQDAFITKEPVPSSEEIVTEVKFEEELGVKAENFEASPQESESVEFDDFDENTSQFEMKETNWKPIIIVLVLFIVSVGAGYFGLLKFNEVKRPPLMLMSNFESLKEMVNLNLEQSQYEFYVSKDRSKIWLGTNISYEGDLVLKAKTVPSKHLGKTEVEFTSYGTLKNNIATFEDISFIQGENIVEGYYSLEVYTTKKLSIPLNRKLEKLRKREFRYFNTTFLGHLKFDKFERMLSKILERERKNEFRFWGELREKYLTIKMISVQIQSAIENIFKDEQEPWAQRVKKFESEYKLKYADFFTSFVLANEDSYSKLEKQDFPDKLDIISNYARLSRIAKSIGSNTMEVLYSLESKEAQDEAIKKEAEGKLVGIIDLCDQKIQMIDEKANPTN